MNHQSRTLRGLLTIMVATAALPAVTASAEDRFRIPLPPPPSEVIRDVRGFIHGIGRGIKRGAQRVFNDEQPMEEQDLRRPRRDYGPNGEWDGQFYPDEYDRRGPRPPQNQRPLPPSQERDMREIAPRDIPEGPGGWTSEEQLRREEASREAARNYQPSDMPPTPPTSKKSTQPRQEAARTPASPPQPLPNNKEGALKENTLPPTTTTPKTTTTPAPSTEVQYASPVPGKKGLVYPPGVAKTPENMVDVGDFKAGQLVRNPRNGELFRVP
ncbi:hypothetical protein DES53_11427 [Roseimicrobium gellanilyticum]|uniref:Uncharacterized protein n=1 Tax=Roseimicrobium gellanilyticum TaxID=748857 RepID=A0A366H5F8_9BACT|nr:hypothetical protein [Roseimicrobium gellanilyticum]RBP37289.1 hypothetical protein DES53_11427 [Roseimicrobium gellanilyticum]